MQTRVVLGWLQCTGQGRDLCRLARALGKTGGCVPSCNHGKVCTGMGGHWGLMWTAPWLWRQRDLEQSKGVVAGNLRELGEVTT